MRNIGYRRAIVFHGLNSDGTKGLDEIVCLNTAPILYLVGKARDIEDGFEKARRILESGRAIIKLTDWIREQNLDPERGEKKLERLLEEVDAK
jgi:anthranilate phosphoribosyltransferase